MRPHCVASGFRASVAHLYTTRVRGRSLRPSLREPHAWHASHVHSALCPLGKRALQGAGELLASALHTWLQPCVFAGGARPARRRWGHRAAGKQSSPSHTGGIQGPESLRSPCPPETPEELAGTGSLFFNNNNSLVIFFFFFFFFFAFSFIIHAFGKMFNYGCENKSPILSPLLLLPGEVSAVPDSFLGIFKHKPRFVTYGVTLPLWGLAFPPAPHHRSPLSLEHSHRSWSQIFCDEPLSTHF